VQSREEEITQLVQLMERKQEEIESTREAIQKMGEEVEVRI
jgi:hypothetical protein